VNVETLPVSFDGLDAGFKAAMHDSLEFLSAAVKQPQHLKSLLSTYEHRLRAHILQPGLVGVLAGRCLVMFPWVHVYRDSDGFRLLLAVEAESDGGLRFEPAGGLLWDEVNELFDQRELAAFRASVSGFPLSRIRVIEGGKPVAVWELLARYMLEEDGLPFEWMKHVPYSNTIIRPLVQACRSSLPQLLSKISDLDFRAVGPAPGLLAQDLQRIVKIVRNTHDQKILRGAAVALSTSKFIRLAGQETILKIVQAENGSQPIDLLGKASQFSDRHSEPDQAGIVEDVAKTIMRRQMEFPFRARTWAASYLAARPQRGVAPLLSLEDDLGLAIQGSHARARTD